MMKAAALLLLQLSLSVHRSARCSMTAHIIQTQQCSVTLSVFGIMVSTNVSRRLGTQAANAWVPSLLLTFVETIIPNALKQTAVCHSIVQAACLQSALSPLLFRIGVSLDHMFSSKIMLDMLSRLGFCAS